MENQNMLWSQGDIYQKHAAEEKDTNSSGSTLPDEHRPEEDYLTLLLDKLRFNDADKFKQVLSRLERVALLAPDSRFSEIIESYPRQSPSAQFNIPTPLSTPNDLLQKSPTMDIQEASKLFLKAKRWISEGRLEEALTLMTETVLKNPHSNKYRMNLSILYIKLKRFKEALSQLSIVLSRDPSNVEAHWRKGDCLHAQKRYEQAMECYQQGLKLKPSDEACLAGIKKSQLGIFNTAAPKFTNDEPQYGPLLQRLKLSPPSQIDFSDDELKQLSLLIRIGKVKITH